MSPSGGAVLRLGKLAGRRLPYPLAVVKQRSCIASGGVAQELMGTAEIAELMGVSRQRVHQITQRPDFPEPVARLVAGHIWDAADVRRWIKAHRDV